MIKSYQFFLSLSVMYCYIMIYICNSNSALPFSIFKANNFSNFFQFLQTICDAIRDYEPIVESLTQQADDLLAAQVNDPKVKPAATKLTNAYRELEQKAQVSNDGEDDDDDDDDGDNGDVSDSIKPCSIVIF